MLNSFSGSNSLEALQVLPPSYPALLLQAGMKRARHEAPPATAKAVVMQLEGCHPEKYPLDVQQQVWCQQQRW